MNKSWIYIGMLIIITSMTCFSLLEHGFFSIDEESYAYITKSIVDKKQFHFETDYFTTHSQLNRAHLGVVFNDKIYSAFPPGYPFLASPFYFLFGIEGMQLANIFFTVLLVITFYFFVRDFYCETDALMASVILLLGTQILNYSVSLWSHISAALFILLSMRILFRGRVVLSGLAIGASIVVRYSALVIVPVLIGYLYKKERKAISKFLIATLVGLSPLFLYNYLSFGSPFISGMNILNAEEGYHAINMLQIPKGLIKNLLDYTFFPELEFMPDKGSLLETSPFFAFAVLGAYLFWKEKKDRRAEFYTLVFSAIFFIFFISGTWSFGGLAHNMRLLTDIVPLIVFFSIIPLFHLRLNYDKMLMATALVAGFFYLFRTPYQWMKFYNLFIVLISLIPILAVLILRKDLSSNLWKGILSALLILSIGTSVFTAVSVTNSEAANRRSVKAAAQTFETAVPEGSTVFIFGGEYPTYTTKDYLFLDYRYAPEDIPRVVEFYKNRSIYVLFKDESDKEKFSEFQLAPAGPIRAYELKPIKKIEMPTEG
jgi:4-amino-4-deoxy-L-arabinose transferase-like glycosyltransferase